MSDKSACEVIERAVANGGFAVLRGEKGSGNVMAGITTEHNVHNCKYVVHWGGDERSHYGTAADVLYWAEQFLGSVTVTAYSASGDELI